MLLTGDKSARALSHRTPLDSQSGQVSNFFSVSSQLPWDLQRGGRGPLTEAKGVVLPGLVANTRIGGDHGTGVAAVLDVDNVAESRADDL
jgi:hypothetical protein